MGACLGVSIYKKLELKPVNHYVGPIGVGVNPLYVVTNYYQAVASSVMGISSFNFKLVNLVLLGILIAANFIRWAFFGRLTANELRNLKDKSSYTAWEFCCGFMIFYYSTLDKPLIEALVHHELLKFGGLFLCVFFLKCFHYLSVQRVQMGVNNTLHDIPTLKFQYVRFTIGLIILNIIDFLLVYKYFLEVASSYSGLSSLSLKDNILVSIFGFEILHISPLIVLTSVKYLLECFELFRYDSYISSCDDTLLAWSDRKTKIIHTVEFLVNLLRFGIAFVFSILFLYFYTLPLHIMPSSYLSLRVLILKSRSLINIKKKQLQLQKFSIPPPPVEDAHKCIICFDDFSEERLVDVRVLHNCTHQFHYSCLKTWLNYSESCPICREEL